MEHAAGLEGAETHTIPWCRLYERPELPFLLFALEPLRLPLAAVQKPERPKYRS